jgi:molybdate transport system substrate-binding protein
MIRYSRLAGVVGAIAWLAACGENPPETVTARSEITVAAAANLIDVFGVLGPKFEAETGIHPVFSFASTAQLTQQIENAAPFDVIAAADSEHVEKLDRERLLAPGSRVVYALGVLAMWVPPGSKAQVNSVKDLVSPSVRAIAVANPELAPYGKAALDFLDRRSDWPKIKPKIVYAENINIARQYGRSNNADVVFTAYSLVVHEGGKVIRVTSGGLEQEAAIVAASRRQSEARRFLDFLLRGKGHEILMQYGYGMAREASSR